MKKVIAKVNWVSRPLFREKNNEEIKECNVINDWGNSIEAGFITEEGWKYSIIPKSNVIDWL